jgi:cell division protein FtsQ
VHKIIPDKLKIFVTEHSPFAIFSSDYNNYILVNEFGEKINIPDEEIANFGYLFLVVDSNFDSGEVRKVFNRLSIHDSVARRVSAIIRVGDRRWDLRLRNNVLVRMPENSDQATEAWTALADLMDTHGLDVGLEEIDLRVKGKIFLKYESETREKIDKFSKKSH